jgi:hypothetical protein
MNEISLLGEIVAYWQFSQKQKDMENLTRNSESLQPSRQFCRPIATHSKNRHKNFAKLTFY